MTRPAVIELLVAATIKRLQRKYPYRRIHSAPIFLGEPLLLKRAELSPIFWQFSGRVDFIVLNGVLENQSTGMQSDPALRRSIVSGPKFVVAP